MSVDLSKVEVGMKVKLRNGSVSEVAKIREDGAGDYRFVFVFCDGFCRRFGQYGDYVGSSEYDIIEILPSEETKTDDTPLLLREVPSAVIPTKQATLRDMYFCAALTGILTALDSAGTREGIVRHAFEIADEALKQRSWK